MSKKHRKKPKNRKTKENRQRAPAGLLAPLFGLTTEDAAVLGVFFDPGYADEALTLALKTALKPVEGKEKVLAADDPARLEPVRQLSRQAERWSLLFGNLKMSGASLSFVVNRWAEFFSLPFEPQDQMASIRRVVYYQKVAKHFAEDLATLHQILLDRSWQPGKPGHDDACESLAAVWNAQPMQVKSVLLDVPLPLDNPLNALAYAENALLPVLTLGISASALRNCLATDPEGLGPGRKNPPCGCCRQISRRKQTGRDPRTVSRPPQRAAPRYSDRLPAQQR